jgi:hypothetical protein
MERLMIESWTKEGGVLKVIKTGGPKIRYTYSGVSPYRLYQTEVHIKHSRVGRAFAGLRRCTLVNKEVLD